MYTKSLSLFIPFYLFNHSPIEGHLGRLQFLTITNKAAGNNHVHVFVRTYVFISQNKCPEMQLFGGVINIYIIF